jgi:hypothetical protein
MASAVTTTSTLSLIDETDNKQRLWSELHGNMNDQQLEHARKRLWHTFDNDDEQIAAFVNQFSWLTLGSPSCTLMRSAIQNLNFNMIKLLVLIPCIIFLLRSAPHAHVVVRLTR